MKLSNGTLDEGRALILASDLDRFVAWTGKHAPLMTPQFIRDTYEKVFKYGDIEKGLRLFEAVFPDYDPGGGGGTSAVGGVIDMIPRTAFAKGGIRSNGAGVEELVLTKDTTLTAEQAKALSEGRLRIRTDGYRLDITDPFELKGAESLDVHPIGGLYKPHLRMTHEDHVEAQRLIALGIQPHVLGAYDTSIMFPAYKLASTEDGDYRDTCLPCFGTGFGGKCAACEGTGFLLNSFVARSAVETK